MNEDERKGFILVGTLGLGSLAVWYLSRQRDTSAASTWWAPGPLSLGCPPHPDGENVTPPPENGTPLGRYFTVEELSVSATAERHGLDNTPRGEALENLQHLVNNVLDPFRALIGKPIRVNSGYRSPEVNSRISAASSTSQHMEGRAVDFLIEGMEAEAIAQAFHESGLDFDQLIWYTPGQGGHVHISYVHPSVRPNRNMMRKKDSSGYHTWTPSPLRTSV